MNQFKMKTGTFTGAAAAFFLDLGFIPDHFQWWMNEAVADTNIANGMWNKAMSAGDAHVIQGIDAAGAVVTPDFEGTNGITVVDTYYQEPVKWLPNTTWVLGDIVHPSINNGYYYKCTTGGAGGAGPGDPAWSTTPGGTNADNAATWTCYLQDDLEVQRRPKKGLTIGTGCMTNAKVYCYTAIRGN